MTKGELDAIRARAKAARKAAAQGRTLDGSIVSSVGCRSLVDTSNPCRKDKIVRKVTKKRMKG